MNKLNPIAKYASLKLKLKKIEEELKELQPKVFNEVFMQDDQQLKTNYGEFKIIRGKEKWNYSKELIEKEKLVLESFKIKKREEQLKGIATLEASPSVLVFKPLIKIP